jgi:TRAP-type C4-dicarboxylate transport system permease small subunit
MEDNADNKGNAPKGSRSDIIIYLIMGVFFLLIMFPAFSYAVYTGAKSDTVWFGFIDTYVMAMIVTFGLGLYGFYACKREIRSYKRNKEK